MSPRPTLADVAADPTPYTAAKLFLMSGGVPEVDADRFVTLMRHVLERRVTRADRAEFHGWLELLPYESPRDDVP